MAEWEGIPQETRERIESAGSADLVIGLPACGSGDAVRLAVDRARDGLPRIAKSLKALVLYPDTVSAESVGNAGNAEDDPAIQLVPYPWPAPGSFPVVAQDEFESFHAASRVSRAVNARACSVWNLAPERIAPAAVDGLIEPVLNGNFDLAVPRYLQLKFGSLINSGIIYPFTRALYGRRVRYPMAADLGLSRRLVDRLLQREAKAGRTYPIGWMLSEAVCAGLQVCQANVASPPPPPQDAADLSSILLRVLGALFLDMERNAAFWQKIRGSQAVPTSGEESPVAEEQAAGDVHRMIETFQLGYRNLLEIWGVALPPAALLEFKKLTKALPDHFRLSDDLWARTVYDFALAHRQRQITRDHLLRAMTPLYLAWVASYALEVSQIEAAGVEERLEQLALAFERQKPYLLSRWRWPDRFNP